MNDVSHTVLTMRCRVLLVLLCSVLASACTTSPTGRSQFLLLPEQDVDSMGLTAFEQLKQTTPVLKDPGAVDYARCVAISILRSMPDEEPANWEIVVFDDDQVNAFALPGGRIGIYRGLLKTAANQHQLATVVGHEIAHVRAHHANERVSAGMVTEGGLQLLQVLAGQPSPGKNQLFAALGLGAQVGVLLPFSRTQESEADVLGLRLMAAAGFDPRESIPLWENMQKAGGSKPPEFLSTHPSGSTRIQNLTREMPQALVSYEQARQAGRRPNCG